MVDLNNVYVYLNDEMPAKQAEYVTPCLNGYTVYINAKLNHERQLQAFQHALKHIVALRVVEGLVACGLLDDDLAHAVGVAQVDLGVLVLGSLGHEARKHLLVVKQAFGYPVHVGVDGHCIASIRNCGFQSSWYGGIYSRAILVALCFIPD